MKPYTVLQIITMIAACCCMACMKGADTKNCVLNTGSQPAPGDGTLVYSVTYSNSAFLRSLTYHGLHGPVKVDTPQLPFTITLSVPKDMTMSLTAEGTAIEGHLAAGYVFTGAGHTINKGDTCAK
jgi:hypothetical protein